MGIKMKILTNNHDIRFTLNFGSDFLCLFLAIFTIRWNRKSKNIKFSEMIYVTINHLSKQTCFCYYREKKTERGRKGEGKGRWWGWGVGGP
jgi:hypothetical protein